MYGAMRLLGCVGTSLDAETQPGDSFEVNLEIAALPAILQIQAHLLDRPQDDQSRVAAGG
jgi:hypothetical protein